MFAVVDIDATVAGLRARGAELVGEAAQYEDSHRLCTSADPGASSLRSPRSSTEAPGSWFAVDRYHPQPKGTPPWPLPMISTAPRRSRTRID
jgi:hypothetical protein